MLKREIKFEDFDGNPTSGIFYFNISKAELFELEFKEQTQFRDILTKIVETTDHVGLVQQFKKIILMAYGVRSDDGKRFVKSDELANEFTQTPAYDSLFMELATNEQAGADFIEAVLPKDLVNKVKDQDKPDGPPPARMPAPPTT